MGNIADEEYLIDKEHEGCTLDEFENRFINRADAEQAIKDALMHWEKIGEYDEELFGEIINHIDCCPMYEVEKAKLIED